ncbi:metallophosphoesterase [Novosphingobium sediminis]|uniref:Metallophosphoesterase n=1 Tax=Novosphingobium sediminis TaxID=707214 RepID=A0A512AEQ7_9SPHN|nr:metallophosphoesterase [Novosphingobium sediminis]GEN98179.1 metallophosphoesterase [Novosphingobium sediminis]
MEIDETLVGRRQAFKCLGWAGTGALYALSGGIATSLTLDQAVAAVPRGQKQAASTAPFAFLQISDTHIGFAKAANPDPVATLRETVAKIRALPVQPDFLVHTGDISHLARPDQFDLAQQVLGEIGLPIHFVPGEHDLVDGNDPRPYIARFAPEAKGNGWYSFDVKGVHFIALVNVVQLGSMGMGTLGADQLAWLKADLAGLSSSTPIVVLSHFPLWALYPEWGWGTEDAATALALLRRFGSVTALNGHVHQVQRKVEGHMSFHAARSTAYPQPAPGVGPGPGPLVVPPEQLRSQIGVSTLRFASSDTPIAILDAALA